MDDKKGYKNSTKVEESGGIKNHLKKKKKWCERKKQGNRIYSIPPITYYWTGLLILDHTHFVGNLTNSKIA